MLGSTTKNQRKKQPVHTLIVLLGIVFICCMLTWVIPAGQYNRIANAAGVKMVDATSFHFLPASSRVNPLLIPHYLVLAVIKNIAMMFMVVASGAGFGVIIDTGAIHSSLGAVALKYKSRRKLFVVAIFWMMAFICITQSLTKFLAFVPVILLICRAAGLDSISACACILFGSGVGFSCGMLNSATTLICQDFAELPPYSGLWLRTIAFVLYLLLTTYLLLRYMNKIIDDPTKSPSYEIDLENASMADSGVIESYGPMTPRKWGVIAVMATALCYMAYGCITKGWMYNEISEIFIAMAIVGGLVGGLKPNDICKSFVNGGKGMMGAFFLLMCARAIALILADGKILDTIVYALGLALSACPMFLRGIAMYVANTIINFGIPSGSGQAGAVMPIMIPLADLAGLTRQTAVLAFNFGDGFCNMITPTATNLVTVLGLAKVPYDKWMKFMLPIFAWWSVLACALMFFAQFINYGPF